MNPMTDLSKEYVKNAVMTASPEQLQLMLLDGAIRCATQGLEAIRAKDIEATFNSLDRAQRIVLELSNGLRRDVNPTLVDQMAALYDFIFRRLIDANLTRDPWSVEDALRILRHQRDTWALVIEKLKQDPPPGTPAAAPSEPSPAAGHATEASRFVAEG